MSHNDTGILARTVFGEARGEPADGKLAVAWVVLNRFRSGQWFAGRTITATCLMAKQFSCWNDGDPNRAALLEVDLGSRVFTECVYVATGAMTGHLADPVDGATHYHAVDVHPLWSHGHTSVETIGRHVFYAGID